ncbi:hypothetical protein CY35_02G039600 [Sphagnum magellanicum]|nr:hypothetical protein CY35_02G039600 [Sphagnum magellanicum]
MITTVQCLFCVHIECEKHEGPDFSFQPKAYKNHHESQHHEDWTNYQLISHQENATFFKKKEVSGIHSFLDKDKDSLQFVISRPTIVDDVVGDLFFHPEEDEEDNASKPIMKANTMKLFKLQEDGSYLVIEQHHSTTKNAKLNGLNDHMVSQFVRILLVVSLHIISDVLTDPAVWAFSLAADANIHLGVPLLDQQIHVCVKGMLYNLHLVLVPFFKQHIREKVISISSDGENTMTSRHAGVVTLLENECLNHVFRIWCVPHQLDIVVKNATHGVLDEAFYKVAHAFSVHLRAQQILVTKMGSKCPKDMMRWVAFDSILHWLLEHRRRLMIHVVDKRSVQAPSTQWWVIAGTLAPLFEQIAVTFATFQSSNFVISQQRQEVLNLMADIVAGLDISSIVDATLINEIDPTTIIQRDGWIVTKDVVVMHIRDQGSWAHDLYNEFFDIEKQQTLQEINIFSLSIVADGLQIHAERDSNNNARELKRPHDASGSRQDASYEHRELLVIYAREPDVKVALNKHDEKTFFNEAWDCLKGRFM